MANIIPSKMRALVTQEGHVARVQQVDVPILDEDNTVLVKTKTAALNPSDWRYIKQKSRPGVLNGCDFAGEIVKIGKNLNPKVSLIVGDRVMGTVYGGYYTDRGAFAEYVKADADVLWKIPDNALSYEEAVTMGVGLMSSVQALFHPTRLGLVEPPKRVTEESWIFIYGGSTSVGHFAIPLAHLAGYKVVSVASPYNHDLVKSLGADAVFDYKDPEVVTKIKQATNDSIHIALDAISEESSQIMSVNVLAPGPGKVIVLLDVNHKAKSMRADVTIGATWIYTVFDRAITLMGVAIPACPEDKIQVSDFLISKLPDLVKQRAVTPMRIRLGEGGLDGISDGLDFMEAGKVSAEKLVYRVDSSA